MLVFFCRDEFENLGLESNFVQVNNSMSAHKGTLRGMHYQLFPKQEAKLVRCVSGALYDVILDLRAESLTFGQSFGCELTADNRRMMYLPKGFAHGFLTLTDATEALYLVSEFYAPTLERGLRWDDPRFNIAWPFPPSTVSLKDQQHRFFDRSYHLCQQ